MSEKINVVFLWEPEKELLEYLKAGLKNFPSLNFLVISKEEKNDKELYSIADVIIGWSPDKDLIKEAKKLRLFINPGAGVKHLIPLFKELQSHSERSEESPGATLVNGHGNAYFTAQHAVALLLALSNKILPHHEWMKEGKWRLGDDEAASLPIRYRKIGLLGYGAINKTVHKFLSGFEPEFHILKRSWESEEANSSYTKYTPDMLKDFLTVIDTLIVALPQTDETEALIKKEELELLAGDALIVNVGRGSVIDEESLYRALKNKTISAAAIDVWYDYKPEPDAENKKHPYKFPFHELDNIILSPHRAGSPMNDLKRWDEVIENLIKLAEDSTDFLNIVNIERGY